MIIVIFGASGKTGRELVRQALGQGHRVTSFARRHDTSTLEEPALVRVTGDITNPESVDGAIRGQNAVLSALGAPSPARRYPPLTEGLQYVVAAMERLGVPRLIYLSFLGVSAGRHQLPAPFRNLAGLALRHSIADHEANEAVIRGSSLAWTIVRAPKLTNGPGRGRYRTGETVRGHWPVPLLARADVAAFMLQQLVDDQYVGRAPAVLC